MAHVKGQEQFHVKGQEQFRETEVLGQVETQLNPILVDLAARLETLP